MICQPQIFATFVYVNRKDILTTILTVRHKNLQLVSYKLMKNEIIKNSNFTRKY